MKLYGGIDLHSNNSVIVILDEKDKAVYKKKHKNDLLEILSCLLPFREQLQQLVLVGGWFDGSRVQGSSCQPGGNATVQWTETYR